MDHKEMSRRILAIVFVWGFWLLWVIGGIACLTTHEHGRHHAWNPAGLWAAALVWLIVSFFPMILEQWKHGKVTHRCFAEFVLTLPIISSALVLSNAEREDVYFGCFLVMAGLSYSCFRLRQVGLDYLEPMGATHEPEAKRASDPSEIESSSLKGLGGVQQQQTRSEYVRPTDSLPKDAIQKRSRAPVVCGVLLAIAWLLLLFQAAGLVGILLARYPRDPAISLIVYNVKYGRALSGPTDTPLPTISEAAPSAIAFLLGMNQFALGAFLVCLLIWYGLKNRCQRLARVSGMTAIGSFLTVLLGMFIAFLPN